MNARVVGNGLLGGEDELASVWAISIALGECDLRSEAWEGTGLTGQPVEYPNHLTRRVDLDPLDLEAIDSLELL